MVHGQKGLKNRDSTTQEGKKVLTVETKFCVCQYVPGLNLKKNQELKSSLLSCH